MNRLTSADASAGPDAGMDLAWAYDRYGNRWSQTATGTGGGGATQPSLSFGGTNRADGYSYDAAGNLLNDGLHRYTYDGANRILSIDNQSTGYVYDAEGNRVAKLSSGGTVETVYVLTSGNQQLTELNGAGGWNHTNIYAPGGRLLATYDAPGQPSPGYHYNLTDWLGTKRMQTAAGGNQQETCISNPYGDGLSCTGGVDATEQHFTGKDHDTESGLDYFYARYYSETLGRFLSPDWSAKAEPVPYAKLDNPQTLNLYQYMRNNPLGGVDPDGHSTLVFDGKTDTVTVYSKDGVKLGTFPAYNNVDSHASVGKLVNGTYAMQDTSSPHLHQGAEAKENGSIGPGGIFRMKSFKGADGKMHSGVGVHAGRADTPDAKGRSGPEHATEGCIRTNDAGIAKITATAKTDPLTATTVENNRTPPPPPQKPSQSQTPQ